MSTDRTTKTLLVTIAITLVVIAVGRVERPADAADPPAIARGAFDRVDLIPLSRVNGFIMFDRKTGGVWEYTMPDEGGGIPSLSRHGFAGTIGSPGDQVRQTPYPDAQMQPR